MALVEDGPIAGLYYGLLSIVYIPDDSIGHPTHGLYVPLIRCHPARPVFLRYGQLITLPLSHSLGTSGTLIYVMTRDMDLSLSTHSWRLNHETREAMAASGLEGDLLSARKWGPMGGIHEQIGPIPF